VQFERVHFLLDGAGIRRYFLNVFKTASKTPKGQTTRTELLQISLRLFREKGFDATTMRDIAGGAGMSLGAFYYYYPSKDSIVLDYYRQVQDEHARRVAERSSEVSNLRGRLGLLLHTKLDIVSDSRELMGSLLRYTGNPDHPLSFLGEGTSAIRAETIAMFCEALQPERLPEDLMQMLPLLLWAMYMGILLYFLYDKSAAQQRTRKLTDMALDFTVRMISVSKIPVFRPVRKTLRGMLQEAGFLAATA